MINQKRLLSVAACAVALFGLSAIASAAINGTACLVGGNAGQSAATSLAAFTSLCTGDMGGYTFTAPSTTLSFNSNGSTDYTGATYVGTDGGSISTTTGFTGGGNASNAAMAAGGASCGTASLTCYSTQWEIVFTTAGAVSQTVSVTHDDGFVVEDLTTATTIFSAPNPTADETTTFSMTVAAGDTVALFYDECCGAPAILSFGVPLGTVPEPTSIWLFGTVLTAIGTLLRRRIQA